MKYNRIIPRLDIKGPNLVKGIHLEGLRALGSPSDYAKFYYENGQSQLSIESLKKALSIKKNERHFNLALAKAIYLSKKKENYYKSIDLLKNFIELETKTNILLIVFLI